MPSENPFISFAQNGEDVLLHRALGAIESGTYVEIGANHPEHLSVTKSFYDRGWSGLAVEPNPEYSSLFRAARPRDTVIEAAITDSPDPTVTFHLVEGTGLSTLVDEISEEHAHSGYRVKDVTARALRLDAAIEEANLGGGDIHFLLVDVEGAEDQVLRSIDFSRYRPWVLVIESTEPGNTTPTHAAWEDIVLNANYEFCLFDGLSRYYVAREKSAEYRQKLSYPVCIFDNFITVEDVRARDELAAARAEAERLGAELGTARSELDDERRAREDERRALQGEIDATRSTLSWKLTKPLRWFRKIGSR
ncbi:FkbM family methyltransferase [Diaminobutyricimonas sp. TR449]|uniref:FkbM family methyltransferase n=1 Tax=Diaminobutyricimonas sp. TR449 TaxID=2708076 RepID=UPI001423A4B5|nr:FkbM family methyltransferase [Diaminobutyricimonas sp. TR449]